MPGLPGMLEGVWVAWEAWGCLGWERVGGRHEPSGVFVMAEKKTTRAT